MAPKIVRLLLFLFLVVVGSTCASPGNADE